MKKHFTLLLVMLFSATALLARPVDESLAKDIALRFYSSNFNNNLRNNDLQLVYTGISTRGETCFYVFNANTEGFVIISADDRFRPIVGYSNEGPFAIENPSPEVMFYLDKIIEARTCRDAVIIDNTAEEWQSVMTRGKLLSRNDGRSVDYICTTKWNQDSPYNLYAPTASSGPGGRCYAGCVATAMSQVMKRWDHPLQGSGSHSYYCYGYGTQSDDFGNTTYDWDNMPDRLGGNSTPEEIDAVALLMYHCAIAVDMNFSPTGSGANSWDVPDAINRYFGYSDGFANATHHLNVGLTKNIKAFTLSLRGRDLLNQGLSIVHNIGADSVSDSYSLSLGRHILFGITWNFGRMNARNSRTADRADQQMDGGLVLPAQRLDGPGGFRRGR